MFENGGVVLGACNILLRGFFPLKGWGLLPNPVWKKSAKNSYVWSKNAKVSPFYCEKGVGVRGYLHFRQESNRTHVVDIL